MKNKLMLLGIIALASMLSSCSKYQISTLSSSNSVKDEKTGVFSVENDSVKISYSFYGPDAPLNIQVFNKLDKPMYIDWQRSALIVGTEAISYLPQNVNIQGSIGATTIGDGGLASRTSLISSSYTSGSIVAVAEIPKNVTFLPPHSQITNVPLKVANGFFSISDSTLQKEKMSYYYQLEAKPIDVKAATFTKENSPLVFKSYLTLYTQTGNEIQPVNYQHEFFVSKVINTLVEPASLEGYQFQRGDYFFNSQKTGYSKIMTGVGVAAAVGASAAIISNTTTNNSNK